MNDSAGVLTREVRVRVINISASGCLVESQRPMDVGMVGQLRMLFGSDEYTDHFQVVRCQPIQGAGALFHVGLRYLWITKYHAGSIRHGVRHLVAMFRYHKGRLM
jgi:hypothetical protein